MKHVLQSTKGNKIWVVMLSHWPYDSFMLLNSISQIKGDIKEPAPLFEKGRGSFPGGVLYLSSIMGYGWVTVSSYID